MSILNYLERAAVGVANVLDINVYKIERSISARGDVRDSYYTNGQSVTDLSGQSKKKVFEAYSSGQKLIFGPSEESRVDNGIIILTGVKKRNISYILKTADPYKVAAKLAAIGVVLLTGYLAIG